METLLRTICPLALLLPLASCGGSGDIGTVSGRVTLDGAPLPNATVEFVPRDGGRPSIGITDENGEYELMYTASQEGASVGTHEVRVTTGLIEDDKVTSPERVPARYNVQTELTKEVEPGSNTIDLELQSDGPVIQPDVNPPDELYVPETC